MKKLRIAIAGCGNRGLDAYESWLALRPEEAKVVALAEPRAERVARGRRMFPGLTDTSVFSDWRQLAWRPRLADGVIVATPDRLHQAPAVAFARRGYHLLLEKPMAAEERGCRQIVRDIEASGVIFAVAHVLRYAPHFLKIRSLIDEGAVVTIQHAEDVAYWHMAHSYVRGNWRSEERSSFMLLAKSCHDIDLLRYFAGSRCLRVQSFGGLLHFRKDRKPAEAGESRSCGECAFEPRCPYSACKIYLRDRAARGYWGWPLTVLSDEPDEQSLRRALQSGPYGRCVYECDNYVVDHQVVNLEYQGGVTASFTMSAFNEGGRKTVVQGTRGIIRAEEGRIRVLDFLNDRWREVPVELPRGAGSGHGGGDGGLLEAWLSALRSGERGLIRSGAGESLETHLTTFAAERSRLQGTVESVRY